MTVANRDTVLMDLAVCSIRALNGVFLKQAEITEPARATVLARWNLIGGNDRVLLTFVFEHAQASRAEAIRAALGVGREKPAEPEDRRCGTCLNWSAGVASDGVATVCSVDNHVVGAGGPPWPNCRFWRERR